MQADAGEWSTSSELGLNRATHWHCRALNHCSRFLFDGNPEVNMGLVCAVNKWIRPYFTSSESGLNWATHWHCRVLNHCSCSNTTAGLYLMKILQLTWGWFCCQQAPRSTGFPGSGLTIGLPVVAMALSKAKQSLYLQRINRDRHLASYAFTAAFNNIHQPAL